MSAAVPMACPVCGGLRVDDFGIIERYALARCRDCTHLFVASGLRAGELDNAYDASYYGAGEAAGNGYDDYLAKAPQRLQGFAERLCGLERHAPRRGRLLDFGCAVGLFVKVAQDAGWEAWGCERSAWAADYGRRTWGLNIVVQSDPQPAALDQPFDVVTMWDVVEHLENPREELHAAARRLKRGGVLALNTVDSGSLGARLAGRHWRHLAPPHHLQYFSRDSLVRLVRSCGFHVRSVQSHGVLWKADRRHTRLNGLRAWSERLATHWRLRPLADATHLLDEIEIVAVRQ